MEIKLYEKNAKKHPDKQLKQLAEIVKEVGWRQPVVVNQEGVIVVGHGRWLAWKKYGDSMKLKEIWVIDDKGNTVMGEAEKVPMSKEQEMAYRLADNKLNESGWNMELVKLELDELPAELLQLTGFGDLGEDSVYNRKIEAPIYEPGSLKPSLVDLVDTSKVDELLALVNGLDATEDVKKFLQIATTRFYIFDFALIADYYANSEDEKIREIMRKLALVIIDFDQAIENGFVEFVKSISEIVKSEQ